MQIMVSKINDNEVGMMRLLLLWFRVRLIGVSSPTAQSKCSVSHRQITFITVNGVNGDGVNQGVKGQILVLPIGLITYS